MCNVEANYLGDKIMYQTDLFSNGIYILYNWEVRDIL